MLCGIDSGGRVREERHGGRARIRRRVGARRPVPRHAPPARLADRHCRHTLVSVAIASLIDFAFADADVIEEGTLAAVIGRGKTESGQPSFIQQKGIVKSADKVAFIIDNDKYVNGIEGSIPVLVKSVWRRPSIGTAGPSGGDFPLVTKEGHHILDVIFTTPIQDLGKVAEGLEKIVGVVEHGIICNTTSYTKKAARMWLHSAVP
uniref:Uncharacterized protein n=1 Tax=Aegilops tauschii subsp. strangulata TaxID=200361 RepID=A0A453LYR4_AEGTS